MPNIVTMGVRLARKRVAEDDRRSESPFARAVRM